MSHASELAGWSEEFRRFALVTERDGAPTYHRICAGVAEDPALLDLYGRIPAAQRRPVLLLAAVHELLLAGTPSELAAWYPTVPLYEQRSAPPTPGSRHDHRPVPPGDPFPAFAALCRDRREALETILTTRSTQTNEVGRCSVLLPALAAIGATADRPLWLLELGASAGLNLLLDHYAYDYDDGTQAGDRRSAVRLWSEIRHGRLPDLSLPPVAGRTGLDRHPVDPRGEAPARWLLACQWPDHLERFTRLLGALEQARLGAETPTLLCADMVSDLERVVAGVPEDVHLCLMHTWAAAYLSAERQLDLVAAIARVAQERPLTWLFAEEPYEVPSLPLPRAVGGQRIKGATAVVEVAWAGTTRRLRRLADAHHHGRWLHWWGDG